MPVECPGCGAPIVSNAKDEWLQFACGTDAVRDDRESPAWLHDSHDFLMCDFAAGLRRDRDEARARVEQGGDLHALITDGHNLEVRLRDTLGQLESAIRDDWSEEVRERAFDTLDAGRRGLYEWDKRARRSKVDWWNR